MNKLEEIILEVNTNKEILEVLPKNNKKNINDYEKKVSELHEKFVSYKSDIIITLEKRFDKVNNIKEDNTIEQTEKEIKDIENILYLLNEIKTSYEKMDLDKKIDSLSFYYKKNLESVNNSILEIIEKFKEVGIDVKQQDFCHSSYSNEYMQVFFEELKKGDINSSRIKEKFEEIYWKCPEIITHIELDIRYLYMKNEKQIDKYFEKQKIELTKVKNTQDILDNFRNKKRELIEKKEEDKGILINKFLNGKLATREYSLSNTRLNYEKIILNEDIQNMSEKQLDEFYENVRKLGNSIYEYKNYQKYQYIIKNIKQIYTEKDKYKDQYNQTKKEIEKKESLLLKLNSKLNNAKGILKKTSEKNVTQQNDLVLEIKSLYRNLDEFIVYEKICENLNDSSTILEVLNLASSFYKYLYKCNMENFEGITDEEIKNNIKELIEFIRWPYCNILNNVCITEEKDILLIIKDRYKLLNIKIEKEDFAEGNMDNLTNIIENIKIAHNITKNNIDIDEISSACEIKKIINK